MLARTLKLKPTKKQESVFEELFWVATGAWNYLVRKIALDARDGRFYSYEDLTMLIGGHGAKCGLNQQSLQKIAKDVLQSFQEHWRGKKGRPKLKGRRNRLSSVPYKQGVRWVDRTHLYLPSLGGVKFRHRGKLPEGRIKQARLCRKPRGWYLTLFIEAEPRKVTPKGNDSVGVDLGYLPESLATLAIFHEDGTEPCEKIPHPREQQRLQQRLAQAQRGGGKLQGKIQQRLTNARRHRNHEVSRMLVERFQVISISRDNLKGLQRLMGRSVLSAAHGQLTTMTETKGRQAGWVVQKPESKHSTRRCSDCKSLTGPTGLQGLKVRQWRCVGCGAQWDRDCNSGRNAHFAGAVAQALREQGRPCVRKSEKCVGRSGRIPHTFTNSPQTVLVWGLARGGAHPPAWLESSLRGEALVLVLLPPFSGGSS